MDIVGHIEPVKAEYQLGDSISVTLFLTNNGHDTAYLFVPTGRAGGIQVNVTQGQNFEVRDLFHEPEPGLQPEMKIVPGEMLAQEIMLSEGLTLRQPGSYAVELSVPIEVADKSFRDDPKRVSKRVTIRSSVQLTVVAKGGKNE